MVSKIHSKSFHVVNNATCASCRDTAFVYLPLITQQAMFIQMQAIGMEYLDYWKIRGHRHALRML